VKYFDNAMYKDFYQQIGMKVAFASLYHLQSNDIVERANTLIFEAIKKYSKARRRESGWRSYQE
jgi:hypothetical protein